MAENWRNSNRYRGLLVAASRENAAGMVHALEQDGLSLSLVQALNWEAIEHALGEPAWDFIICNYHLPEHSGLEVLAGCRGRGLEVPFLMVSARLGEAAAVGCLKAGAQDYVPQDELWRLAPAVKRELQAAHERRVRGERDARNSYLAEMVESCHAAVIGKTLDGTILSWNQGAQRLYGYTAAEMIGKSIASLVPMHRPDELPELLARLRRGEWLENLETVRIRKDGSRVNVSVTLSPIRDADGRIIGASSVAHDITQRKLEEEERLLLLRDLTEALAIRNQQSAPAVGKVPVEPSHVLSAGRGRIPIAGHLPDSFPT